MKAVISIFTLLISLPAIAQLNIELSATEPAYHPENFHIYKIVDGRVDQDKIGNIREGNVNLKGGLATGLQNYLINTDNKNGIPVTVRITKMDITEKDLGSKRQFNLSLGVSYYTGTSKLVEYNGSSYAQARDDAAPYIEKLVRQNINNNIKQFDNWMAKNKHSISAEPTVAVNVYFSNLAANKNHIAYTKARKLYITDFEGRPDEQSPGAAATLSGIGMKYQSSTLRNKTTVDVTISVYFDKSRSWMKDHGKNSTILLHEQRHFDITAIKACQLKQKISNTDFSADNYEQQLKALLNNAQQEGADMQNTYDMETEHGTIIDEQEKWNKKIEDMLQKQDCY